jgi:hypothetical protein
VLLVVVVNSYEPVPVPVRLREGFVGVAKLHEKFCTVLPVITTA